MPKAAGAVKGLIMGAAVGAIAALLLAPKAGKETRNAIKSGMAKAKGKLRRAKQPEAGS